MKNTKFIALLVTLSTMTSLFSGYIDERAGEYVPNKGIVARTGEGLGSAIEDVGEGIGEGLRGIFTGGRTRERDAYRKGRYDQERIENERESIDYE